MPMFVAKMIEIISLTPLNTHDATSPHVYLIRQISGPNSGMEKNMKQTAKVRTIAITIRYNHPNQWDVLSIHCKYNRYWVMNYQEI